MPHQTALPNPVHPLPRLLHLTADHPDSIQPHKTPAVSGLLATATWADNLVISLNRSASPVRADHFIDDGDGVLATPYQGLPYGMGLAHWMGRVARRVEAQLGRMGRQVDLIHAHKLTFEGLAAQALGQRLGVPHVVTVRGHTDHKVVAAKPLLRARYRAILQSAGSVFFIAPWSLRRLQQQLDIEIPQAVMLPNICRRMDAPQAMAAPTNRFVSLFHFRSWRVKNIVNVFAALARLQQAGVDVALDVIGAADDTELAAMQALATRHGVAAWVRCLPAMSHAQLQGQLGQYAGLVLPSYPETFGMVYIEALSAGLPVIHARDSGIDGYFNDPLLACSADHRDPASIAAAMQQGLQRMALSRAAVQRFHADGGLAQFGAPAVGAAYRAAVEQAMQLSAATGRAMPA